MLTCVLTRVLTCVLTGVFVCVCAPCVCGALQQPFMPLWLVGLWTRLGLRTFQVASAVCGGIMGESIAY